MIQTDIEGQAFEQPEYTAKEREENTAAAVQDIGGIAGQRLKSFLERIERLEEEKAALMEDIREVYAEAKGTGFDPKIMRKIISLRKMDNDKRREMEELTDLYKTSIGMY